MDQKNLNQNINQVQPPLQSQQPPQASIIPQVQPLENQQPIVEPVQPISSSPQFVPQQTVYVNQNPPSPPSALPKIIVLLIIAAIIAGGFFYIKTNPQLLTKIQALISKQDIPQIKNSSSETGLSGNQNSDKSTAKISGAKIKDLPANSETLTPFTKEELKGLGVVELPQGFTVQGEYKGIKFIKTPKKSFTDNQIKLLHNFIDNTPKKLLTPGPSAIITFADGEVEAGFMPHGVVAFASGSYIFFSDKSFDQTGFMIDNDMDKVFSTFEHELVHIAQYNETVGELDKDALNNNDLLKRYGWRASALKTSLITEFANIAGWINSGTTNVALYDLKDKASAVTTNYGKTDIVEDMAETVSGMIMTRDYEFSPQRQDWALKFLGENYAGFKPKKFPFSPLFEETKFLNSPEYDTAKEQEFKTKYQVSDKQIFSSDKEGSLEAIKNFLGQELPARGWTESFSQRSGKYIGEFTGSKRDMHIELSTNPDTKGAIMVVINGYKF